MTSLREAAEKRGILFTQGLSVRKFILRRDVTKLADALKPPDTQYPLEPGLGGKRITVADAVIGDLVLANNVSGVMLYVDNSSVVRVTASTVELTSLSNAIADSEVVVVARHPRIYADDGTLQIVKAQAIAAHAQGGVGGSGDSPQWGKVERAFFHLDSQTWCAALSLTEQTRCLKWVGHVQLGTASANDFYSFYCPRLILQAYEKDDTLRITLQRTSEIEALPPPRLLQLRIPLGYVGHLASP